MHLPRARRHHDRELELAIRMHSKSNDHEVLNNESQTAIWMIADQINDEGKNNERGEVRTEEAAS